MRAFLTIPVGMSGRDHGVECAAFAQPGSHWVGAKVINTTGKRHVDTEAV